MAIITIISQHWHRFCVKLNLALKDSCMDPKEKLKIQKKIDYHNYQMVKNL